MAMELHVVTFRDESGWTARCLEYDLIGESTTEEGALENVVFAMIAELRFAKHDQRKPFVDLPKPPAGFLRSLGKPRERKRSRIDVPPDVLQLAPDPWVLVAMDREAQVR